MRIGVLGTGMVGETIGAKLISLGHDVRMGSRSATNAKAAAWANAHGDRASHGTFAGAAEFGELLFNCTPGGKAVEVLRAATIASTAGKVLVDVSNPLDYSRGFPPSLTVCNTDSIGERIQREFPRIRVVKTLNTMNCKVMVDPSRVPGPHDVFVSGNDAVAKDVVIALLRSFGWEQPIDLGDITTARGPEMMLAIWVRLYAALRTGDFNLHVARAGV